MKKIYIILSHTGTNLSKLIKYITKDEFSHISISLDEELNEMYSFGRLHPYNPFWGGFVHEKIYEGTFKRFKKTNAAIYSLEIDDNSYKIIKDTIKQMLENPLKYGFNIYGLIAVALHKKIRIRDSFYCAEFVKYIFDKSAIKNNLPEIIKPEDFKKLENLNNIYKGRLQEYCA